MPLSDPALLADALKSLLAEADCGKHVQFIVSDAWCHYQVIPRPSGVSALRQLDAIHRIRFQNALGERAASLRLASFRPPFAQTDIVVGLDELLIEKLTSGAANAGKLAVSIRPYWIACVRETPKENKRMHWVIASEGVSKTLGLFQGRHCIGLRRTSQGENAESLGRIIARELALYDAAHLADRAYVWGRHPVPARDLPSSDFEVFLQGDPALLASAGPQPSNPASALKEVVNDAS